MASGEVVGRPAYAALWSTRKPSPLAIYWQGASQSFFLWRGHFLSRAAQFIFMTCTSPRLFLLSAVWLLLSVTAQALEPVAGETAANAPAAAINSFHAALSQAMRNSSKLGCEGRTKLLTPAVDATFDLPFLTERALRRHWQTLSAEQQLSFAKSLRNSVITTYATEFAEADAVSFTSTGSERLANGDALVHTLLAPNGSAAITLDYVLKARGNHWLVVNVLASGVSDLALRATQYDSLMRSEGFAALLAKLDTQTQKLKARCR